MCSLLRDSSRPRQPPPTVFALSRLVFSPFGPAGTLPAAGALGGPPPGRLGPFALAATRFGRTLLHGSLGRAEQAINGVADLVDRCHAVEASQHPLGSVMVCKRRRLRPV